MLKNILNNPIVQTAFTLAAFLLVAICIFPEYFRPLSILSNYANFVMLCLLVAGLLFLLVRQPKLTFVYLGSCALLGIYLKYSIESPGIERWRETVIKPERLSPDDTIVHKFTIAHFNTTNFTNTENIAKVIKASKADIVSFHEVTPYWAEWLQDSLATLFPNHHTLVDIGLFGQALFSKYEIMSVDTTYFMNIPMLTGQLRIEENILEFVNVHTEPSLTEKSEKRLREHLDFLAEEVQSLQHPAIVLGEFNKVPWALDLKEFKTMSGLMESRTGFMPLSTIGVGSFLEPPIDHILFTNGLQCASFINIEDEIEKKKLGISSTFIFKKRDINVPLKTQ